MSRKKPSGGELQTAANRQAILPAQANPKRENQRVAVSGIPRRLSEGRDIRIDFLVSCLQRRDFLAVLRAFFFEFYYFGIHSHTSS